MDLDVLLCDHAQVAGGKLFISGANIDRMQVQPGAPPPYVMNFSVAGLVMVPWTGTNREHTLAIRLITGDGEVPKLPEGAEVGTDGVGGDIRFNVGRPPQVASGDDQPVPFTFTFGGLPLMEMGRYVVVFSLDGTEVRRLTFTVAGELSGTTGPFGPFGQ